jgi:hypothetical protein
MLDIDKLWIWGIGASWYRRHFGDPQQQSSPNELAEFFNCNNVMYFDYEYSEEDVKKLEQHQKILLSITDKPENMMTKVQEVVNFSKTQENIVGAIIDDLTTIYLDKNGNHKISPEQVGEMKKLLVSINPAFKLYAVCYTMNFNIDIKAYLPYIDEISLWVWNARNLKKLDKYMKKAPKVFGNKPLNLGLYMFDFPEFKTLMPMKLLKYEFNKATQYLREQKISGIQILGRYLKSDLESPQAKWIQEFLAQNFSSQSK